MPAKKKSTKQVPLSAEDKADRFNPESAPANNPPMETGRGKVFWKDSITGEVFQGGGRTSKNPTTGNPVTPCNPDGTDKDPSVKPATTRKPRESAPVQTSSNEKGLLMLNRAGIPASGKLVYSADKMGMDLDIQIDDPKLSKFKFIFEKPSLLAKDQIVLSTIGESSTLCTMTLETLRGLIR